MNRPCTQCQGAGNTVRPGYPSENSKVAVLPRVVACPFCEGRGVFPPVDVVPLVKRITTDRGAKDRRRRMKTTAPGFRGPANLAGRRAYYVWRMARLYAKLDPCRPLTAQQLIIGDPFQPELDQLVESVVKRFYNGLVPKQEGLNGIKEDEQPTPTPN